MKNIAAALVKAQLAFGPALKSSSNPHFKSKYADLSACVEAVIEGLNNSGIALVQQTHECNDGVIVETMLIHESGETISGGRLHVPASKQDAQGYGSALTYARRYSLMATTGIAPEDDDGNAASRREQTNREQVAEPDRKVDTRTVVERATPPPSGPELLTPDEIADIRALAGEINFDIKKILAGYKKGSLNFIPRIEYQKIIRGLEKKRSEEGAAA